MRIVSLVPSVTLALHQLGLDAQIVGITEYCIHPAPLVGRLPKVGGTKNVDLEAVRGLRPDLVVANTDEQRAATLEDLEEGPWDLLVTETDSMQDVLDTWAVLGAATGRDEAAALKRNDLQQAIARARHLVDGIEPLPVIVPVWKRPWMATGGGTYVGDLLHTCGFRNLFAPMNDKWLLFHPTLDADEAARHETDTGPQKGRRVHAVPERPGAVLLPTEPYRFTEDDRDDFEALGLPRDRVLIVDGELLTWWLAKSTQAVEEFSALRMGIEKARQANA